MDTMTLLKNMIGKKLAWVGYDKETEQYHLVFEDLNGFGVSEIIPLAGENFAHHYLEASLGSALNVLDLKKLVDEVSNEQRKATESSPASEGSGAPAA